MKSAITRIRIPEHDGDYSDAINRAIDEHWRIGVSHIILPKGELQISERIALGRSAMKGSLTIQGSGDTTLVNESGSAEFDLTGTSQVTLSNMTLDNVSVRANGPVDELHLANITFLDEGVTIHGDEDAQAMGWRINDCAFVDCAVGVHCSGLANDGLIERCFFADNTIGVEVVTQNNLESEVNDFGNCPRITQRDIRFEVPVGAVAWHFGGTSTAPLIVDGARVDGDGKLGKIGYTGRRFGHSLSRVWSTIGPLTVPQGVWVQTFACDGVSYAKVSTS